MSRTLEVFFLNPMIPTSLIPSSVDLFFRRNDPKDVRLGEIVSRWDGSKSYDESLKNQDVVILGWPDDRGITLNNGRPGAKEAPDAIRKALYKLTPGIDQTFKNLKILDLGNLKTDSELEKDHENAAKVVEKISGKGIVPIILGGGNDFAYADIVGFYRASQGQKRLGVINIDAHLDVRDLRQGLTSGTPYFRLLEGASPPLQGQDFIEFAIQPHRNTLDYYTYVKQKGVEVIFLENVQARGARKVFFHALSRLTQTCDLVAVSLDMDSVKQADAPGVSAPSPNGLSAEDVEEIAHLIGGEPKVKLFSIYEVCPKFDRDNQTSQLAASVVWHFLKSTAQR